MIYCLIIALVGIVWQIAEIKLRGDTIEKITFTSMFAVIIIPLFEEILARGFILNKLSEIMSFSKALFVSAAFFLLCHLPGWLLITPIMPIKQILIYSFGVFFVVGIGCGVLMKKSNSLYPSILFHAINNFISSV